MKIETFGNYPPDVKDYVSEYNSGVEHKDINLVGTAISSMVQLLFSNEELNRQASMHALNQVGIIQPGFLKSAIKTLLIRYKGTDEIKKKMAGAAIEGIFIGKKAEKLMESEPAILNELKTSKQQKVQAKEQVKVKEKQIVDEIQKTQIDLSIVNAFPEIASIGQYFNNCLLNNEDQKAMETMQKFLQQIIEWHKVDKSKFTPACLLLGLMFSPRHRRGFSQIVRDDLLKLYYEGNSKDKIIAEQILENIIDNIVDLLPPDLAGMLQAEFMKRNNERKEAKAKEMETSLMLTKLKVPVKVGWSEIVQKVAETYNECILNYKDKLHKNVLSGLNKVLKSNADRDRGFATDLLGIIVSKNPQFVQDLVMNLLTNPDDPIISQILGSIIDDIEKLRWADNITVENVRTAKKIRDAEESARKKERQTEYDRVNQIIIKVDADWEKSVTKMVEALNTALLEQNPKPLPKLIDVELKKYLYAKDKEIRRQGQTVVARIAEKYPDYLNKIMEELAPLFLSDHEERNIAVDAFGMIFDSGLSDFFFKDRYPEVHNLLASEWSNRKQEMENLDLQNKFDMIKADVTQIRIKDAWIKNIQKITRKYNNGIKTKNMEDVLESVKYIVDIVMNEKKDEIQEQGTQVLGLIAKRNIELIQPTITLFLQLIDQGKNKDKKTRAIKGLGEVTRQRPGWAYFGIEKLIALTQSDPDEDFRMKAMLEVGRIGEKDPIMLLEYIEPIINALARDSNKHVRRLAAWTLGKMAEAIPLEAKEAIPALTDALHDQYLLVRKFADKALTQIREAMRKAES
jgi:hypothetical protein